MIISEKIIDLRKKAGLSQEDLANKLGVSRQSVSKWESRASLPEISKIIQMSEIFGVSTDYLLRDDMKDEEIFESTSENINKERLVSLEEANEYMDLTKRLSGKKAISISTFIWSPILIILLNAFSDNNVFGISEKVAITIGLVGMLSLISIAIFSLILIDGKMKKFEYLESQSIQLQYGSESIIRRRQESYLEKSTLLNGIGVAIIILAIIPVVISFIFDNSLYSSLSICFLLLFIGLAVNILVRNSQIKESFQKLLQEEEYTINRKILKKSLSWVLGVYWSVVLLIYLSYSFITSDWSRSWIIWPISWVLSSVIESISSKSWIKLKKYLFKPIVSAFFILN